ALGSLGEKAATPEVLGRLVELSGDPDEDVRGRAAYALGRLGEKAATPEVLGRLVELSGAPVEDVRGSAAEALGALQRAAPNVRIRPRFGRKHRSERSGTGAAGGRA
ncbi:MAG: HEAT repeat domain-containing protein, partial [Acidobacteria bacterium]|nr:HEAT repeat domain-containing protein [Acidobacteriota bacterium]